MTATLDEIKEVLKKYLLEEVFNNSGDDELKDDTPLISGGLMDSITTMQLVAYLEETYDFEFEPSEVDSANLDDILTISEFVRNKIA